LVLARPSCVSKLINSFHNKTRTVGKRSSQDIVDAVAADQEVGDLEAQLKLKREERDRKHIALNEKRSNVGKDVAGNKDFGDDSPLYGAMGFVHKSDRASGLTRKAKTPPVAGK